MITYMYIYMINSQRVYQSLLPVVSHTLTVWSSEAETIKSSFGWKAAHMT